MPKAIRQIRVDGNIAYVPLTLGYVAMVDAADVPLIEGRNWFAHPVGRTVYARCTSGRKKVYLHRFIMQPEDDMSVDHISGDGLDCRRSNMRTAHHRQNIRNQRLRTTSTSGFKGVGWHKASGKWRADIRLDGKSKYLGLFLTPEDAHLAYCAASAKLHGEFGRTA